MNTGVETLLLEEVRGLRTDVQASTQAVTRLGVQMESVLAAQAAAADHGERLALLEQWRKDMAEDKSSGHTERRANLALIVSMLVAVLSWVLSIVPHFKR